MKKRGIKIIISAILFVLALVIPFSNELINNGLFIISYLVVGFEILKKAVRNIFRGKVFDENFLMAVATIGAFAIGEFPEAVAVMLFYQVGELFQSYAVDKSRKSIASLMDIRPDYANIEKDGKVEKVDPDEVKIGDIITFTSSDPRYSGLTITHRIVGIEKSKDGNLLFRTKGDNNNSEDTALVPSDNIFGRVILKIPKIGYIQYVLTQGYGWLLLVVIPCLGIVIYDIIKLVKSVKDTMISSNKKQNKKIKKDEYIELIGDSNQKVDDKSNDSNNDNVNNDDIEII